MAKKTEQTSPDPAGAGKNEEMPAGWKPVDPTTAAPAYSVYAFQRAAKRAIYSLDPFEYAVYGRMWDAYWVELGEPLPADPEALAAILRRPVEEVRRGLTERVIALLEEHEGGLHVPELRFQWEKTTYALWRKSKGGQKGAEIRYSKAKGNPEAATPAADSTGHPIGIPMGHPAGDPTGTTHGSTDGCGRGEERKGTASKEEREVLREVRAGTPRPAAPSSPVRRPEEQTTEEWLADRARKEADLDPATARMNGHRPGQPSGVNGSQYERASNGW